MVAQFKHEQNGEIRHNSFKMADNDLKIWQNYLLPNPFHIVDAKFDSVLRPISHGNPAMPFGRLLYEHLKKQCKINRKNRSFMFRKTN